MKLHDVSINKANYIELITYYISLVETALKHNKTDIKFAPVL